MKKLIGFVIYIVLFLSMLYCSISLLKRQEKQGFYEGLTKAFMTIDSCYKGHGDTDKEIFPEYYRACNKLCQTLYKVSIDCITRISGDEISCVCKK